jgi:hypothetical protein
MEVTNALVSDVAGAVLRQLEDRLGPGGFTTPVMLEWMDPATAAAYLKLTVRALAHMRARRIGPASHKIANKVRYRVDDLRAWAASHREDA